MSGKPFHHIFHVKGILNCLRPKGHEFICTFLFASSPLPNQMFAESSYWTLEKFCITEGVIVHVSSGKGG